MSVPEAKKKVGKNLTEGPVLKTLVSFAIPIILASVVQQLYSVVDMAIMGKFVGSIGSSGISNGGEVNDLMLPFSTALAMGGQVLIAQLFGMQDMTRFKKSIGTLLTVSFGLSLIFMIFPLFFSGPILRIMNCPEEAFGQAQTYMVVSAFGIPVVFGYNAVCGVLRGMGEAKKPLTFVTISSIVHIILALIFVALFHLEAAGVAIATALSQLLSFLLAFRYLYINRDQFGFELNLAFFKIDRELLLAMMKVGIPQLLRTIVINGTLAYVKASVNTYGLVASATYGVGNKVEKFMNVFQQGVDGACGAMMAQNLGARKSDRAAKTMWTTLAITMCMGVCVSVLFRTIPRQLFGFFSTDAAVIEYGVVFLQIMSFGCLVTAFAGAFKSIGVGVGSPTLIFLLGILDPACRLIVIYVCLNVFHLGADSYFWGAALCQLVPGLTAMAYFLSGKWKTRRLLVDQKK